MSTYAYHAIQSESASRLQVGRYSLRVAEGPRGGALLIVSNGTIEQTFDLSSFIVTPFDPSGTLVPYPYPGDSGVIIDTTTLYEAMRLMAEFIIGFHNASETSFSSLSSKTSGFNANGTELTITKLNGMIMNGGLPGTAAPWIATIRTDGVTEVGRILDFHTDYANVTTDLTCRVTCTGSCSLSLQHLAVTGTLSGPTITSLTTQSTTLRTDVDAITLRVTHNESISTTLRTDVDAITFRVTDEETKSTTLRTDVDGLTSRMGTAEGTLVNHASLISSASSSATAVNARVTRIMGTHYYPNGYDDPSNKDFRTLEWVVDYMLKYAIPVLGSLESSNTFQSVLIVLLGAVELAELTALIPTLKEIEMKVAGHTAQILAHEGALRSAEIAIVSQQTQATADRAAITLHTGQIASLLFLSGFIGVGLYAMINRKNGPMTYTEVPPSGQPKYSPVVNDTDPVALIGYTDPIARIINDVSYEVADARLIKFEGSDARIDPTLRVDMIIVSTLNGVDPSEYALASSLSNYATKTSLSNYALASVLSDYALASSLSNYVTESFLASSLVGFALESSLSQYAPLTLLSNYALASSLSNYATTSSLNTLAGRVNTINI